MAAGREGRAPVPGVLVEGGTKVAVLPGFSSVLEIVEGGQNALDRAHQSLKHSPAVLGVGNVTLLAPIPHPPQMRDFLCFEKHLVQAFQAIGKNPPPAWYERPLFYHPSRFHVCGPRIGTCARCPGPPTARSSTSSSSSAATSARPARTSRSTRRASTSSATPSSTTSPRATSRPGRWRASSGPARARTSTTPTPWARAW